MRLLRYMYSANAEFITDRIYDITTYSATHHRCPCPISHLLNQNVCHSSHFFKQLTFNWTPNLSVRNTAPEKGRRHGRVYHLSAGSKTGGWGSRGGGGGEEYWHVVMEVDKPPQTSYVALTHQLSHGCSDSLMGEERETDVFCLGCGGPGMAVGFCEAVEGVNAHVTLHMYLQPCKLRTHVGLVLE